MKARCPLHLNVTAALLDTISDMKQQLDRIFAELDAENFRSRVEVLRAAQTAPGGDGDSTGDSSFANQLWAGGGEEGGGKAGAISRMEDSAISRYRHREVVQYHDMFHTAWPPDEMAHKQQPGVGGDDDDGAINGEGEAGALGLVNTPRFPVCHEFCAPLPLESRMSFTILNLTGQRTRYFQPRAGEETRRLQYLRVSNKRGKGCLGLADCSGSAPCPVFRRVSDAVSGPGALATVARLESDRSIMTWIETLERCQSSERPCHAFAPHSSHLLVLACQKLQPTQDGERGVLLFTATMTVVRNGRVQEVPFDTQTEAFDWGDHRGVTLPTIAARGGGGERKVGLVEPANKVLEAAKSSTSPGRSLFRKVARDVFRGCNEAHETQLSFRTLQCRKSSRV